MTAAPCAGKTELMFDPARIGEAVSLCHAGDGCPMMAECARLGADEAYGVWGGMAKPQTLLEHNRIAAQRKTEQVIAAYQAGASTRAVGEQLGVSHSTVGKLLRDAGVERRRVRPFGPEMHAAFIEAYQQPGANIRIVAERFGVSREVVRKVILKAKREGLGKAS